MKRVKCNLGWYGESYDSARTQSAKNQSYIGYIETPAWKGPKRDGKKSKEKAAAVFEKQFEGG